MIILRLVCSPNASLRTLEPVRQPLPHKGEHDKSRFVNRRRFLAVAGSAVAAPLWIPRHAGLGRRAGANDRIGIGYIGVGRRGNQLMGLHARPDRGGCRRRSPAAGRSRREAATAGHADYREMLEAGDVDAASSPRPTTGT